MTKNELLQYRELSLEIQQLNEKIEHLYTSIKYPKPKVITDMPITHSGLVASNIEETICKIDELRTEYENKLNALLDSQKDIEKAIDCLPTKERCLMRYRYIEGYSWNKICNIMNYSYRTVHRIHNDALKNIS